MKYLFILGRNPELSAAEIRGYIKRTGNEIVDFFVRENAVLVELRDSLDADAVDYLGGTIAIGLVMCRIKEIDRKEIYIGEKNNFNYAIWDYSDSTEDVSHYLKGRFKKEKLKASEKKLRKDLISQDSDKVQILTSKTVDEEYFVFEDYFGKVVQRCNYKNIEERDMSKPVRRESLSISPRMAKIMINISEVKENEILLDAFCGICVVLIEALNQNIKVVGVDLDKNAIQGAKENLEWFNFSKDNYKLINNDSSKVNLSWEFDAMVSEPDFGDTLKKIPTHEKAEEMIKRFEKIMIGVLKNAKKYMSGDGSGRFVFTSPLIRIGKKRIGADLKILAERVDLKLVEGFPLPEFREGQIVGREVVVFERE